MRRRPKAGGSSRADPGKIGSAQYRLFVALEAAIDLCDRLIARNGCRAPEDQAEAFRVMAEAGALREDFTGDPAVTARFPNRRVHR